MRFVSMTEEGVRSVDVDDEHALVAHKVTMAVVRDLAGQHAGVAVLLSGHTIAGSEERSSLTIVDPETAAELVAQLSAAHGRGSAALRFQNALSAALLRKWRQ